MNNTNIINATNVIVNKVNEQIVLMRNAQDNLEQMSSTDGVYGKTIKQLQVDILELLAYKRKLLKSLASQLKTVS